MVKKLDTLSKDRPFSDYNKVQNDILRSCGMGSRTSFLLRVVDKFYLRIFRNGNVLAILIFYLIEVIGVDCLCVVYSTHYPKKVKYLSYNSNE